jgi:hypothetical protein
VRTQDFLAAAATPETSTGNRHRARQLNFDDQSIFTYANANEHWWGYA